MGMGMGMIMRRRRRGARRDRRVARLGALLHRVQLLLRRVVGLLLRRRRRRGRCVRVLVGGGGGGGADGDSAVGRGRGAGRVVGRQVQHRDQRHGGAVEGDEPDGEDLRDAHVERARPLVEGCPGRQSRAVGQREGRRRCGERWRLFFFFVLVVLWGFELGVGVGGKRGWMDVPQDSTSSSILGLRILSGSGSDETRGSAVASSNNNNTHAAAAHHQIVGLRAWTYTCGMDERDGWSAIGLEQHNTTHDCRVDSTHHLRIATMRARESKSPRPGMCRSRKGGTRQKGCTNEASATK